MKFNLAVKAEVTKAFDQLTYLSGKHSLVEIIKISPKRTLHQNNYLHLIISDFGNNFGYSPDEAKIVYKDLSPSIYKYQKKGRTFYRSSADLTKEEMATTIDRLMKASADAGYPLPPATNQAWLREIENRIEAEGYT